jgi:UDP-N-acetylglucosamine 2-epimerase (non-hydrolysing)
VSGGCDIATIVGARPQFVKCALVSKALRRSGLNELLVHTGQHYDDLMSDVFFRELDIPWPDVNLNVGSSTHAEQTAAALVGVERVLQQHRPRLAIVYGDTNSTLAGALAAVKLGIPVAHVEAGLRSDNRAMPEEINRVATDHWSELLFCHNEAARSRLAGEKVPGSIAVVGDVMRETLLRWAPRALSASAYPAALGLSPSAYAVLTVHRPVNAQPTALGRILDWCAQAELPVVFPAHPRVRDIAATWLAERGPGSSRVRLVPPLGYSDMLALIARARLVLTDSGGLQKEACFLQRPCITLRSETEWNETVESGWNVLAGDRPAAAALQRAFESHRVRCAAPAAPDEEHAAALDRAFGPSNASEAIVDVLRRYLDGRRAHPSREVPAGH